jgi:hypothetical protein
MSGFGGRIIIIVLSIIILSQVLGTLLSVLSFEKVFLKALTYKYEILGRDLKRKIEQALKFGKPLDRFLGMDRLAKPLFRLSDDLDEIFISNSSGKIFFTFERVEFVVAKGAVDEGFHREGKILLGDFEVKKSFPAKELFDWEEKGSVIRLYQGRYHVMFPIIPRYGGQKGILGLVFNKSVVDEKKKELISSSRNKLTAAVVLTAVAVALLIRFLFVAPVRRQIGHAGDLMGRTSATAKKKKTEVPEEVLDVQLNMADFITQTQLAKKELKENLDDLEQAIDDKSATFHTVKLMKEILKGKEDEGI